MSQRYLVTAGLPYSNGRLHVGHIAGAYLPADIFVRYLRACGRDVLYICGSDDNGVAIEISAVKEGKTPQEISSHFHARQKADFDGLNISFDIYGGTHQPAFQAMHERFSQEFFRRIHERGYFVKKQAKQLYDAKAKRFLPDRYVHGACPQCGATEVTGDQCDQCRWVVDPLLLKSPISVITGEKAEVRETTHWYLRLNQFEEPLREWLESKQGQWRAGTLNFALGQIKQGLPERAMTRDIAWGIPVPLDDPDAQGKVLFVWFDAPIGYISFTASLCEQRFGGWKEYEKWWADPESAVIHFIGEDNTVFHALIWPAMLMADERHQLPHTVVANNYLNFSAGDEIAKISKSKTPAESPVWIEEYLKQFDADPLRYYLTAVAPETARTMFDTNDFITRNNSELVAAFGNFVNRSLTFAQRYFDGRVPDAARTEVDEAHIAAGAAAIEKMASLIEAHRYKAALEEMMAYARACNLYFDRRQPWRTRKDDMADCGAAIATCVHAVHHLAIMSRPILPKSAERILGMLNVPAEHIEWAAPKALPAGHPLGEPAILFAKLDPGALA
jgi:methionyl-tRNA synthetase